MDYCALSAMPVGRFVLDVHGEDPEATWPLSDPICAALQIINHLQDCGRDFQALDRVYLPLDRLAAHGVAVAALGAERATPALRAAWPSWRSARKACSPKARLSPVASPTRVSGSRSPPSTGSQPPWQTACGDRDPLSERVHLGAAGLRASPLSRGVAACLVQRTIRTRLQVAAGSAA